MHHHLTQLHVLFSGPKLSPSEQPKSNLDIVLKFAWVFLTISPHHKLEGRMLSQEECTVQRAAGWNRWGAQTEHRASEILDQALFNNVVLKLRGL